MLLSRLTNWLRQPRPSISRKRRTWLQDGSRLEALEQRIVLSYLGSFRVPKDDGSGRAAQDNAYSYAYGGDVSTVDAEGDELWLSGHAQHLLVGKIAIPVPVKPSAGGAFKELPIARPTTPVTDITDGLRNPAVQDTRLSMVVGDLVPDKQLVRWVIHNNYNVSQTEYRALGAHDVRKETGSGPYEFVYPDGRHVRDQMTGRYLAEVPKQWTRFVRGTHVAGGGGLPGQSIIGAGPSLYAFKPPGGNANALTTSVTATPLLEYPWDDNLAKSEQRRLPGWNRACRPLDSVWIGDTVVVVARIADAPIWYGNPDGPGDLYDWYIPWKTYHSEHYEMRLLFYHASDLAAVAQGKMEPWEPQPYENVLMPNLMGPDVDSQVHQISLSYDPDNGRMYAVQTRVDISRSRYHKAPVVHVYDMSGEQALKKWAFELSGRRPTLRHQSGVSLAPDSPAEDKPQVAGSASEEGSVLRLLTGDWAGEDAGDAHRQKESTSTGGEAEQVSKAGSLTSDDAIGEPIVDVGTEPDDEGHPLQIADFWTGEYEPLLAKLNDPLLKW